MSFQTVEDLQLKISFQNELLLNKPQILSSEECPVCLQLLCRPLNCPNGHNLCEQCYDNLKNKQCPICRKQFDKVKINLRNENLSIQISKKYLIKCPYYLNQCSEIFNCDKEVYEEHILQCEYAFITCTNKHCKQQILRKNLQNHIDFICEHTLLQCKFCLKNNKFNVQYLERNDYNKHLDQCQHQPIFCEYCEKEFMLKDIQQHQKQCKIKTMTCKFCGQKYSYKEKQEHDNLDCFQGENSAIFQLLKNVQNKHDYEIKQMKKQFQDFQEFHKIESVQKDIEISRLQAKCNYLQLKINKLDKQNTINQEENSHLNKINSIYIKKPLQDLLNQGFQYIYIEDYSFVLQNNIINNIKQNCKQDTQICVGAIDTIQNKDEFLVCCIDNALEALKETYSFQKANKTQKGNYFYNVEGSSFGFSSQQEIQLLQSIDNACKSDKFRLSWYLNGKGGGRIMDQFDVNNSRYKKVIMLKQ